MLDIGRNTTIAQSRGTLGVLVRVFVASALTPSPKGASQRLAKLRPQEGAQRWRTREDDCEMAFKERPYEEVESCPRCIIGMVNLPEIVSSSDAAARDSVTRYCQTMRMARPDPCKPSDLHCS